jgi:uncharacterized coiled-coil protein SlyX
MAVSEYGFFELPVTAGGFDEKALLAKVPDLDDAISLDEATVIGAGYDPSVPFNQQSPNVKDSVEMMDTINVLQPHFEYLTIRLNKLYYSTGLADATKVNSDVAAQQARRDKEDSSSWYLPDSWNGDMSREGDNQAGWEARAASALRLANAMKSLIVITKDRQTLTGDLISRLYNNRTTYMAAQMQFEFEQKMETVLAENKAEIARLNAEHAAQVDALNKQHAAKIDAILIANQAALDEQAARYEAVIAELNGVIDELKSQLAQSLVLLNGFADKLDSYQASDKRMIEETLAEVNLTQDNLRSETILIGNTDFGRTSEAIAAIPNGSVVTMAPQSNSLVGGLSTNAKIAAGLGTATAITLGAVALKRNSKKKKALAKGTDGDGRRLAVTDSRDDYQRHDSSDMGGL